MKTSILVLIAMVAAPLRGSEVTIRVVDEEARPVALASALIGFAMVNSSRDDAHKGITDSHGVFSARGNAEHSVYVRIDADGYYQSRFRRLPNDRDLNLSAVLRKIVHPLALHALRRNLGTGTPTLGLSVQNEWLDYDLAAGDWVKPRGKGEVADIRFKFHNEFKGWQMDDERMAKLRARPDFRNVSEERLRELYAKFDGDLEISFPGEKEGLVEERERFLPYSQLTMPHEAPTEGYAPTRRYTANTYSPRKEPENVGFFLRTRVKLDKDGKIISANYAKVTGDFQFDARGILGLTYYFNPTPNDRNLEFDPKKNLFPANLPGANVNDP